MRGPARIIASVGWALLLAAPNRAEIAPGGAALYFDFSQSTSDLSSGQRPLRLHGAQWVKFEVPGGPGQRALAFADSTQYAAVDISRALAGIEAASVGGWFYCRRKGEQWLFARGIPYAGPNGQRMFSREEDWVNFVLGSDERGFLLGTINGNGEMPFPHVTVNELGIDTWSQLVVVKRADGYQDFYQNGTLVHSDRVSDRAGKAWPFRDAAEGRPVRLAVSMGGAIGEAWIFGRELTAGEIRADFEKKKARFHPAAPGRAVTLRDMDAHAAADLWKTPVTAESWPGERSRILNGVMKLLGPFPAVRVPLDPKVLGEQDCGTYIRRKISIQVQPDDRMPAYVLIPKNVKGRVPAVICFYGTTQGAGKERTVGLTGRALNSPPEPNASFAIDVVEAGMVAFAADYLRDGERISPGRKPYDSTDFYQRFPDWSIHGKDVWDNMRAVDYLQSLEFVDGAKIGMMGHSYGGHSTIFAAALEPRIRVAVSNGPVSSFRHHGLHWAAEKGARSSQSLPAMRPYVLDPTLPIPATFYEFTALIAPKPLLVGQASGERRPREEENHAAVKQVYEALGHAEKVRYHWYAGDHDFPPAARKAAMEWFRRWFSQLEN